MKTLKITVCALLVAAFAQGCANTPAAAPATASVATASASHAVVDCAITEWNGKCPR